MVSINIYTACNCPSLTTLAYAWKRLYVSPKLPPTPVQKKITPRQWLSEGRNQDGGGDDKLPSLDDVRKSLLFNIEEAESLSEMMSRSYPSTSSQQLPQFPACTHDVSIHALSIADTKKRLAPSNKKPQRKQS